MGRTTCHALCAGPFAAAAFTDAASGVGDVLVTPRLRPWLSRLVRGTVPTLSVLAYNEVPDNRRVRVVSAGGR